MNIPSLLQFIVTLSNVQGSRFASLTYRSKESGELARFNITLGFSYRNLVERSLSELEAIRPSLSGIDAIAADELLVSFRKTLSGTQDGYTKAGIYESTPIDGLKVNSNDNSLQLFGLERNRVVLVPGTHKVVNSAPKTIAKNALRKSLPVGKFKEFALDAGNIASARLEGDSIVFDPSPEYINVPSVVVPLPAKKPSRKAKAKATTIPEGIDDELPEGWEEHKGAF
jgi:hypothetical protein